MRILDLWLYCVFCCEQWNASGTCEQAEGDQQVPAGAGSPRRVVDYDWKSVIRENFMRLTQHVDPDTGLLNELLSRRVISHVSADVIRVSTDLSATDHQWRSALVWAGWVKSMGGPRVSCKRFKTNNFPLQWKLEHLHVGETFNRFADFGLSIAHKCLWRPCSTRTRWGDI